MKLTLKQPKQLLLSALALTLVSSPGYAEQNDSSDDELNVFTAITFGTGFQQANRLDSQLLASEEYKSFNFINFEARLDYKGFFAETTGKSQLKVDGQFAGKAIGYNIYNTENWSYDVLVQQAFGQAHFTVNNPEDEIVLKRKSDSRFGMRATGHFEDLYAQFIFLPYSFRDEIGGIDASFSIRQNWQYRNWIFYNSLGLRYRSSEILDHYWGLNEHDAQLIHDLVEQDDNAAILIDYFEPFDAQGGFTVSGSFGFEYPLTESWVFGGFFDYEVVSDSVKDSPLYIGDRTVNAFGLTMTYVF